MKKSVKIVRGFSLSKKNTSSRARFYCLLISIYLHRRYHWPKLMTKDAYSVTTWKGFAL